MEDDILDMLLEFSELEAATITELLQLDALHTHASEELSRLEAVSTAQLDN